MKHEKMTYAGVTPEKWEIGKQRLAAAGIPVAAPVGEHSASGFRVAWNWDERNAELTVVLKEKPFWAPMSITKSKVNEALAKEGILPA